MVKKQNEEGYALLVVLMVLLIFSVLAASLLRLNITHHTSGLKETNDKSAFYIAEAGLNFAVKDIERTAKEELPKFPPSEKISLSAQKSNYIQAVKKAVNETPIYPYRFERQGKKEPAVQIVIKKNESPDKLKVIATGEIGNERRILTQYVTLKYAYLDEGEDSDNDELPPIKNPVLQYPKGTAAFVNNKISLSGGAFINGHIGTNLEGSGTISFEGGANLNGSIYVPEGNEYKAVKKANDMNIATPLGLPDQVAFPLPVFPAFPVLSIVADETIYKDSNKKEVIKNGNLYIDNYVSNGYTLKLDKSSQLNDMFLNGNNKLVIDVGNEDKILVLNNLYAPNGHIKLVGSGKLTIMVKKSISLGSGSKINDSGNVNKLNIYLDNDSGRPNMLKLAGDQKIYGSLFAKNADIEITGGGGFQGNIMTGGKKVTISGGGSALSTLLLAPNADINLTGGGEVRGTILGQSLTMNGGTSIKYGEFDVNPDDFFPPSKEDQPQYKPVLSEVVKTEKVIEE